MCMLNNRTVCTNLYSYKVYLLEMICLYKCNHAALF
uniref:Uncharacterized protein n=1 Tax=Setaria italica TaxID=4555 RepID=K3ZZ32_SETIT